jgi:hypothetical protein
LLRTHADAEAAFNQIRGGASFESVATAKSIDTQSAQNGGILGCLQPGEFVPAFEQAAETVPFDTVTVPVQSQFGYHLILVRHWSTDEVGQQWRQIAQQEEAKVYGPRLASMTVHIDPRYGSWQKGTAQQAPRVVPPVAPEPREARDASTPTS